MWRATVSSPLNHILVAALAFLPMTVGATVQDMRKSLLTHEYATCVAYFAVLAQGMENKPDLQKRLESFSQMMLDEAIERSNEDFAGETADKIGNKMLKEMMKGDTEAKMVINSYNPKCKILLRRTVRDKQLDQGESEKETKP